MQFNDEYSSEINRFLKRDSIVHEREAIMNNFEYCIDINYG
jgi:hypothetical protein